MCFRSKANTHEIGHAAPNNYAVTEADCRFQVTQREIETLDGRAEWLPQTIKQTPTLRRSDALNQPCVS
jgi:hypothetical protein